MLIAAALSLALAFQTGPSYKIGGDTVQVKIPEWKNQTPPDVYEFNGWKYGFSKGTLVAKGKKGFDWEDVSTTSLPGGVKQKFLINLVTRTDTLTYNSYFWQRQGTVFADDLRAIKHETALFCHLVNVLTEGKVEVEPTWRIDEITRFVDKEDALGEHYLEQFVNATDVKPSEGLGPFAAILVLSPMVQTKIAFGKLDGCPTASIPLYDYFDRSRPGQLARIMLNSWLRAKAGGTFLMSDPLGSGPLILEAPSDWIDAPWQKFLLHPAHQIDFRASIVANGYLLVQPAFAELYAAKLGRQPVAQSGHWVIFESHQLTSDQTDVQRLGISPVPVDMEVAPPELAFTPGQAEQLPTSGSFTAKTVADPDRGSVGEIKESSFRRNGWVRLLSPFDGASQGVIEFSLKPRGNVWPVNIVVVGDGTTKVFCLFGTQESAPGYPHRYSEAGAVELDIKAEPVWQKVAFKHGMKSVEAVYLATPSTSNAEEMDRGSYPSLLFDDLAAKAAPTGDLTPVKPAVPMPNPIFDRARIANTTQDEAALLKLLTDESVLVRLTAAHRFLKIKNPAAVPALATIASSYNPRMAEFGAGALAFQGTEAAIGALRYNYQNALGDYVKQFSANNMPAVNERKILSELSLGLNARRPDARAAAARALARQPFKEATMVLLSFLNDVEPVVRAAAIEAIPEKQPAAFQRVLGFARNDPSDYVRSAAFRKLAQWGAPEAAEISKDPSLRVRASK